MAAAVPYIITAVGTIAQMSASNAQGDAAYRAAQIQADQARQQAAMEASALEREANDDRATAQRAAEEARRQSRLKQSRAIAMASASGAGAADPTVLDIVGGLQNEGDYNAASELYKGEDSATYKEWRADVARVTGENQARMTLYQGKVAKSASRINAVGSLAKGAASMYGMYSQSTPSSSAIAPAQQQEDYNNAYQPGVTSNWWNN